MLGTYDSSIEKKWTEYWATHKTYAFDEAGLKNGTLQTGHAKPIYSIDTPPPFTSGTLHMGHVLSYSYFDFVARYKRMNGFNVFYPQGWDTQGFPTEVKVEKEFGRLPREEFRKKCMEFSREQLGKMKQQMNEMGFSPDWNYEYITMEPEYHRKVQHSLIEMFKKGVVYRAEYPVFWCPKCASAIAKAELEDQEKQGILYSIKIKIDEKEQTIATTRPEYIPACVAIMYHPEDTRYNSLKATKAITALGKEVPLLADKDVDKEFGTGLVQVCSFGDKQDVVWINRHKLPTIHVVDQYGKMKNTGIVDGLKVVEARKKIIEHLKAEGKIASEKPSAQVAKVHDRCKTLVELIASKQWFADIRKTGALIKKFADDIEWVPSFGKSYLVDWVENAEWDWVISRQRVFGTPLPFYYCNACNKTEAATTLPFYAEKETKKPCECGGTLEPELSTCDCWVDSSITPLIISGWPDNKERFEAMYPVSLRPQGVEIVRTWAFYTVFRSGFLTGKAPFKTILLNGNVLGTDGKKMSKSIGNVISPSDLIKQYPVDAIRQWAAMAGALAKDRPFSFEDIKYAKSFINKLWNAAKFVQTTTPQKIPLQKDMHVVDRWMVGRMNEVIKTCTESMEKFEFNTAISSIHMFFWQEFCDDYLEFIKHRIYGTDEKEKKSAQGTVWYVIESVLLLLAPFMPFVTEEMYQDMLQSKTSIHRAHWPKPHEIELKGTESIQAMRTLVAKIRQYKAQNKLAQNAPVAELNVVMPEPISQELANEIQKISKIEKMTIKKGEELNVN